MRLRAIATAACLLAFVANAHAQPNPLPAPTEEELAVAAKAPLSANPGDPGKRINWIRVPNGANFEAQFPRRALDRGISGNVVLRCIVQDGGTLACAIVSETPEGHGFGEAARRLATYFRMQSASVDGTPSAGSAVTVPVNFLISDRP